MCNRSGQTIDYKHIVDPLSLHILRSRNRLMLHTTNISDSSYYYSLSKSQPKQTLPKLNNVLINNYGVRKTPPPPSLVLDAVNNISNFSRISTDLDTTNSRKFSISNKEVFPNRNSFDDTMQSISTTPTILSTTAALYPIIQHPLTLPNVMPLDVPPKELSTDKLLSLPSMEYIHNIASMDLPLLDVNCNGMFSAFLQRRQRGEKRPIPEEQKDEKYYEKRKRNNEAAKKSRDARKIREDRIAFRAAFLEQENSILKAQLISLRNELQALILNKTNI